MKQRPFKPNTMSLSSVYALEYFIGAVLGFRQAE